jgi:thymidylate synthase
MYIHKVEARDLPDLWFQAIHDILDHGKRFVIDKGSYAGQTRLEYDYFIGHVKHPGTLPLIPDIPPAIGIPNPVEEAYVYGGEGYERSYIEYIMTAEKQPGESYTYGERLNQFPLTEDMIENFLSLNHEIIDYKFKCARMSDILDRLIEEKLLALVEGDYCISQVNWVIWTYKNQGYRNNQMVLQVAKPDDITLQDPPCLRSIDTRIQDGKLNFIIYFRSWDLWGGMPANLAGLRFLQEYMAGEIGVEPGEMIVESKGLHLYGYAEQLAKLRCMRQ